MVEEIILLVPQEDGKVLKEDAKMVKVHLHLLPYQGPILSLRLEVAHTYHAFEISCGHYIGVFNKLMNSGGCWHEFHM